MREITREAYAKINLGLDVIGRRPNGYHEVKMIMQTIGLHDTLILCKREDDRIVMTVSGADLPCDDSNLCVRAAKLISETCHLTRGVQIDLVKRIPVAAGMAGGSTDCAAVLIGMNQLFDLNLNRKRLMDLGVKLGADVPYCVMGGTALSEGIGEILTPVKPPMMEVPVLIAKPEAGVSTREVYEALDAGEHPKHPDIDGMLEAIRAGDYPGVTSRLGNILEDVTIPRHPEILAIKECMADAGADGVLMSGSGPTVFGLFTDEKRMRACADELRSKHMAADIIITAIRREQSEGGRLEENA